MDVVKIEALPMFNKSTAAIAATAATTMSTSSKTTEDRQALARVIDVITKFLLGLATIAIGWLWTTVNGNSIMIRELSMRVGFSEAGNAERGMKLDSILATMQTMVAKVASLETKIDFQQRSAQKDK